MITVESKLNQLILRVQNVKDYIGIGTMTCCEYYHLIALIGFL